MGSVGKIVVSGGAVVTFYDDVTQNGTLTVSEVGSTNSVAVFLGNVYGAGGSGGGDIFYEGAVHPGSSPALVTYVNDVTFGSADDARGRAGRHDARERVRCARHHW